MYIQEITEDLRLRAKQSVPAFSTRKIIEACFPGTLVTGRDLPPHIDEVVTETASGIVIFYRRNLPTSAQRFAIAHALAHMIFDRVRGGCRPGSTGELEREARADDFAAELLLPLEHLERHVAVDPSDVGIERETYLDHVDEIASHFRVPSFVVDKRIRELRTRGNDIAKAS